MFVLRSQQCSLSFYMADHSFSYYWSFLASLLGQKQSFVYLIQLKWFNPSWWSYNDLKPRWVITSTSPMAAVFNAQKTSMSQKSPKRWLKQTNARWSSYNVLWIRGLVSSRTLRKSLRSWSMMELFARWPMQKCGVKISHSGKYSTQTKKMINHETTTMLNSHSEFNSRNQAQWKLWKLWTSKKIMNRELYLWSERSHR